MNNTITNDSKTNSKNIPEQKTDNQIKTNIINNKAEYKKDNSQSREKRIKYFILIFNTLISIVLIVFAIYIPFHYSDKWKIFFFMTLWSFCMNSFYIISVTIIDWIRYFKKRNDACFKYNNFVRNIYLRICFPFAVCIVFLYWMLILLGDRYEYRSRDMTGLAGMIFFHGVILLFLSFDIFTAWHKNIKNYCWDLIVLSIFVGVYYIILIIGKVCIEFDPYDFMERSNARQLVGTCILIYISILDGYVIFNLIANRFFEQEDELYQKMDKIDLIKLDINANNINKSL